MNVSQYTINAISSAFSDKYMRIIGMKIENVLMLQSIFNDKNDA